jgi:hypothetical protein
LSEGATITPSVPGREELWLQRQDVLHKRAWQRHFEGNWTFGEDHELQTAERQEEGLGCSVLFDPCAGERDEHYRDAGFTGGGAGWTAISVKLSGRVGFTRGKARAAEADTHGQRQPQPGERSGRAEVFAAGEPEPRRECRSLPEPCG